MAVKESINIGSRKIGSGCPCYIIGEIGLNHNGSMEIATKLIDVAKESGVDAVKFQKRSVNSLATNEVLDSKDNRFPEFGSTYREIRMHLEFGRDTYKKLRDYSNSIGLDFLCTPFDIESLNFLESLNIVAYKLASHSLTNLPLLECAAALGKSVILSTGMSDIEEIDSAVEIFKTKNVPLALLHCVSAYPTPVDVCNLATIDALRDRFNVPVGYSGHEVGFIPTLASVARGANIVERHITLDRDMEGFDHKLSLNPEELRELVLNIRTIESAIGDGVKKLLDVETITRDKYHVSMVSARAIEAGRVVSESDVVYKNPGIGIPPKDANRIIGKRASRDIAVDVLLDEAMFK